jgi:hypothetical protein
LAVKVLAVRFELGGDPVDVGQSALSEEGVDGTAGPGKMARFTDTELPTERFD